MCIRDSLQFLTILEFEGAGFSSDGKIETEMAQTDVFISQCVKQLGGKPQQILHLSQNTSTGLRIRIILFCSIVISFLDAGRAFMYCQVHNEIAREHHFRPLINYFTSNFLYL
eukprot:TRINITY_DN19034_c0_g1_i1.p1 TRINITY_DN19034_c0_g1~~TRINITY_DN19034_c0_g1_i1.p1  ORF type:complete len:132 (-),score=4.20 TRINITY_DN19034_c0_g1_i1:99-437(-)